MKFTVTFFVSILLFTLHANAQLFEDFESGTLDSYALTPTEVELESGVWIFHQALLGSTDNDRTIGTQAPRLRDSGGVSGNIAMGFDKANGAGLVSFYYADSAFFSDGDGRLQLQYSTDQGDTWTDIGDELECSDSFQQAQVTVNMAGDIRFRILHTGGGRINIDNFEVTDFAEGPTISVLKGGTQLANESTLDMNIAAIGSQKTQTLTIRNLGNQLLDISGYGIIGDAFDIYVITFGHVGPGESMEMDVLFSPSETGEYTGELTIYSNADNHPQFVLNLEGEGFERDVIPISEARQASIGTRVSVGGSVTVADEFSGPVYFEDETGALAWLNEELMRGNAGFQVPVSRGDSLVVTATLQEVNALPGQPGSGMLKLMGDEFEYEVFSEAGRDIQPMVISGLQLMSGNYRGRLVRLNGISFSQSGSFQGGSVYTIGDRTTTSGRFRVNPNTDISGTSIPSEHVSIVGISTVTAGNQEVQSRSVTDLDSSGYIFPGDDIPQDQTLDVVTWNIEWFGHATEGPGNIELQIENVKTVIETLNADLYAFQEIANNAVYNQLAASLSDYSGMIANYTQTQKTAYLYNTNTIEMLNFGLLSAGQNSSDWAGRLPFWLRFNANIGEESVEIDSYNIHAKAFSDATSYNQRVNSSNQLKTFLDNNRPNSNVIVIGDYNDNVTTSTRGSGYPSPYQNFMDDAHYYVATSSLESAGYASFRFSSMIDHITFTNELIDAHIKGAQRVDDTSTYISNFLNTTSDHFPVMTRFYFGTSTYIDDPDIEIPSVVSLSQNYPNPFNPSTNIQFTLSSDEQISLTVYDITGRRVATLVNGEHRAAGTHTVTFNASGLASGMYLYRLSLSSGLSVTNKMMFVK